MKRFLSTLIAVCATITVYAQPSYGGTQLVGDRKVFLSYVKAMEKDVDGNIVVAGIFQDTLDLDNGPGTYNLISDRGSIFVAKYGPTGQVIWGFAVAHTPPAQQTSSGDYTIADMALDNAGNIYIAGDVRTAGMDFDPGAQNTNTGSGVFTTSGYVVKYSSAGAFQWLNTQGTTNGAIIKVTDLAVDNTNGKVRMVGDLDNSSNTFLSYLSSSTFPSNSPYYTTSYVDWGHPGTFITTYNTTTGAAVTGTAEFGIFDQTFSAAIVVLPNGSYVFGRGYRAAPRALTGSRSYELHLYNSTGTLQNTRSFYPASINTDPLGVKARLLHDAAGNVYLAGSVTSSSLNDPPFSLNLNPNNSNFFAIKMTGSNLAPQWGRATEMGSANASVIVNETIYDETLGLLAVGNMEGSVDFDASGSIFTRNATNGTFSQKSFLLNYTTSGNLRSVGQIGGFNNPSTDILDICMGTGDTIITAGGFTRTVDFNLRASDTSYVSSVGSSSSYIGFISKHAGCTNNPPTTSSISGPNTFCSGAPRVYNVSTMPNATDYVWNMSNVVFGITASQNSATVTNPQVFNFGTLYVKALNACGLSEAAQTLVITNQVVPVTLAVTGPTLTCAGANLTFSTTATNSPTSYTWQLPQGWTGSSTSATITCSPANSGVVTVFASNGCGAGSISTISVTVNQLPAVSAGPDITVCQGLPITINATGAASYSVTPTIPLNVTTTSYSVGTTLYTIRGTGANGCTASDVMTLVVNPRVTLNSGTTLTAVPLNSTVNVTITATGGTAPFQGTGIIAQPVGITTYTVTDANGCSATTTRTVVNCTLPEVPTPARPSNGALAQYQPFSTFWQITGNTFDFIFQSSTDPNFSTLQQTVTVTNNTSHTISGYPNNTTFYWRVRCFNSCGESAWSSVSSFTTSSSVNSTCQTLSLSNIAQSIPDNSATGLASVINVPFSGTVTDVNVEQVNISHSAIGNVSASLTAPNGVSIMLFDRRCGANANMNLGFDSQTANTGYPCPPTNGSPYEPAMSLDAFQALDPSGQWTLRVFDRAAGTVGTLNSWRLQICYQAATTCTLPAAPSLTSPLNNSIGQSTQLNVSWASVAGATSYNLQSSTDAAFSSLFSNITVTGTSGTIANMQPSTRYYWRVYAINNCGSGAASTAFTFVTSNGSSPICSTFVASGLPVTITDNSTAGITATLNIPVVGTITDVNVRNVSITHPYIGDLTGRLRGPLGSVVNLFNSSCTSSDNMFINFDDEAGSTTISCPPTSGQTVTPVNGLFIYDGLSPDTNWGLILVDNAADDVGVLNGWSLEVCYLPSTAPNPCSVTLATSSSVNNACGANCNGSLIAQMTNGTGPYTYRWSTGATSQNLFNVCGGSYSVTGTDALGCSATIGLSVTNIPAVPNIQINPSNRLYLGCSVTSHVVNGTGGTSYVWSTGATSANVTLTAPGTYRVTGTTSSGCTNTASVEVLSTPNPSITGPTATCAATNATYTLSGGFSYNLSVNGAAATPVLASGNASYNVNIAPGSVINYSICNDLSPIIDGNLTEYGAPVATQAGGPSPSFGAGHELNALYFANSSSHLHFGIAGNVQFGNRILLFIDSKTGGFSSGNFGRTNAPQGLNNFNSSNSFDAGFLADYCVVIGTDANRSDFYWDFYELAGTASGGGGVATYLGSNTSADLQANPVNGSQTNGFEFRILRSLLGNPTADLRVMAMYIADNGFLSNQFLTKALSYESNYGSGTIDFGQSEVGFVRLKMNNICCTNANFTITNAATPASITAPNGTTLSCTTNSVVLSASTGTSYLWSTGATSQNITVTSANTYRVTVTNGTCSATASVQVTSNTAAPNISITAPTTVVPCNGNGIQLTANGGTSYLWSNGSSAGILVVFSARIFTVTGTAANGCTGTASVTVTQAAPPSVSIATPATLTCVNTQVTLTATGANSYVWVNGPSTASRTVTAAGVYTVIGTNSANGCTASASTTVTSNTTPPSVSIATPATLTCVTTQVTLTATGANSYTWVNGPSTASRTVTAAGVYTVVGTNSANGCTASASTTVTSNTTPPSVSIATPATLTCVTTQVTLTATGANSYTWVNGPSTASRTVTAAGVYTVVGTNSANGCTASASTTVTSNTTPPSVSIATPATLTCANTQVTLTANGANSYVWVNGPSTASRTVTAAGVYTVVGTNSANGCTTSASTTVTSNTTPPSVTVSPSSATLTCAITTVQLSATGGTSYIWSNGQTTSTISATTAGLYRVTVTSANGCTSTGSVSVSAAAGVPQINITPSSTQLSCITTSVTLTANGANSYLWENGVTTASRAITAAGTYIVTGTNTTTGCTASQSIVITNNTTAPVAPVLTANQTCTSAGNPALFSIASYTPTLTYTLVNSLGVTIGTFTSTQMNVVNPGTYTVRCVNPSNGCQSVSNRLKLFNNPLCGFGATSAIGIVNLQAPNHTESASETVGIESESWNVYPNPTSETLFVQIDFEEDTDVQLALFSVDGRQIWKHQETGRSNAIQINVADFPSGQYFIRLSNKDKVQTKAIQIVR